MLIRDSNNRFSFEIRRDGHESIFLQTSEISLENNTRRLNVSLRTSDDLDKYFSNWMRGFFAWMDKSDSLNSLVNAKIIITDLVSFASYEFNKVILAGYSKDYQVGGGTKQR